MKWRVNGIERYEGSIYERCVRKGSGGDFLGFRLGWLVVCEALLR